jgi:hypothetical protein
MFKKQKLNYCLSSLTIISIVLIPLTAIAETKPESSIEVDIKTDKSSLVEKLIQSKQLVKQSQQKTQFDTVISTSAADLY